MEKVSYALGLSLGNNLLSSGIKSLNIEKLAKGIQDVLEQKSPEIPYEEAQNVINEFFMQLQEKSSEKTISEGRAFLEANGKPISISSCEAENKSIILTFYLNSIIILTKKHLKNKLI